MDYSVRVLSQLWGLVVDTLAIRELASVWWLMVDGYDTALSAMVLSSSTVDKEVSTSSSWSSISRSIFPTQDTAMAHRDVGDVDKANSLGDVVGDLLFLSHPSTSICL